MVSNIFCFHPYRLKWSNLISIFWTGWFNHEIGWHPKDGLYKEIWLPHRQRFDSLLKPKDSFIDVASRSAGPRLRALWVAKIYIAYYIACLVAHCCHFPHVAHLWAWMGPIPLDLVFLDQEFMRLVFVRIFCRLAPKGPCSKIAFYITNISLRYSIQIANYM